MDVTQKLSIIRLTPQGGQPFEAEVAGESLATIFINGTELATLLCTPDELDFLAVGFLVSEGLLQDRHQIAGIDIDATLGTVRLTTKEPVDLSDGYASPRLITSGCGGSATFYSTADADMPRNESQLKIDAADVFDLVKRFQHLSPTYRATHGVHSAALSDGHDFLAFSEDIGRHNAVDKVFGRCLLEDIPTAGRLLLTSGRVSLEILHKVSRHGIPIIISVSSPISLGIKMAEASGITLVGGAKGGKINVYTHAWRIVPNGGTTLAPDDQP